MRAVWGPGPRSPGRCAAGTRTSAVALRLGDNHRPGTGGLTATPQWVRVGASATRFRGGERGLLELVHVVP
jgi:hypothetical protein